MTLVPHPMVKTLMPIDGTAVFGDEDEESDEIEVPPVKRFRKMMADKSSPPPPRAYHPLTGEPLTGSYMFLLQHLPCLHLHFHRWNFPR